MPEECPVYKRLDIVGQCGDYRECGNCDTTPRAIPVSQVSEKALFEGVNLVELDMKNFVRDNK